MRFPPNWSMELVLVLALFLSVVVTIFAMQNPPGDRTRFTRSGAKPRGSIGELRRLPLMAEETVIGR